MKISSLLIGVTRREIAQILFNIAIQYIHLWLQISYVFLLNAKQFPLLCHQINYLQLVTIFFLTFMES